MKIKFIPGVHPSYKEQFDKLTRAYIGNEVNPFSSCACFVGNLLNGKDDWAYARMFKVPSFECNVKIIKSTIVKKHKNKELDSLLKKAVLCIKQESNGLYTISDIIKLERLFLYTFNNHPDGNDIKSEEALFEAFEKTLELLKQIHISKGEIIEEETPIFIKRKLQLV